MRLPYVKINFQNGMLGSVAPSADGVIGLLAHSQEVSGKLEFNKAYKLQSIFDLPKLGIVKDSVQTGKLHKTITEFYAEAGEGAILWLSIQPVATKVSDWFTGENPVAAQLLDAAQGAINILATHSDAPVDPIDKGVDADVWTAANAAQLCAVNYTNTKMSPFIVLIEGYGFAGDYIALPDLSTYSNNRVAILIGDTIKRNSLHNGAAIGVLAGRLARISVATNIGRVMDGATSNLAAFVGDTPAELSDYRTLNDKGYLCFRNQVGKAGYYFADDHLMTAVEDDYHFITRRRTIDKAYRIAYNQLLNYQLDQVPVTEAGELTPAWTASVETMVEQAIATLMTANGELSTGDDNGVQCYINPKQNVIATGSWTASLRVRPFGYGRYIDIDLSFFKN